MFKFFANKSFPLYTKQITQNGAGDSIQFRSKGNIRAYVEPIDGEKLIGSELGDNPVTELVIYTQNSIAVGDLIYISDEERNLSSWFEIRRREFFKMPFFNYFKGYLVKTDENIRI